MFQEFPYTNFHELNLDWIVKIAKDFLDQYTHIQEVIQTGLEDLTESRETGLEELNQKTLDGLADLQEKYDTLDGLLQAWYDTHSADIAEQLAAAIADFNTAAEAKSQALLDSWPDDYSELVTEYNELKNATESMFIPVKTIASLSDDVSQTPSEDPWGTYYPFDIESGKKYLIAVKFDDYTPTEGYTGKVIHIRTTTDRSASTLVDDVYYEKKTTDYIYISFTASDDANYININLRVEPGENLNFSWCIVDYSENILNSFSTLNTSVETLWNAAVHGNAKLITDSQSMTSPYDNLNTLPVNEIVTYAGVNPSNIPSNIDGESGFSVVTLSRAKNGVPINFSIQLLVSILVSERPGSFFYRVSYGQKSNLQWTNWACIAKQTDVDDVSSASVHGNAKLITDSQAMISPYDNLNTLPVNEIVTYVGVNPSNIPVGVNTGFSVVSLSRAKDSVPINFSIQILVTNDATGKPGDFYYRISYGSKSNLQWSVWSSISKKAELFPHIDFSMFQTMAVLGDSYASGCYIDTIYYDISWVQMLARKYGAEAANYSDGGLTTRTWLTAANGLTKMEADTGKQLYFVAFGINDSNPDSRNVPIGTKSDFYNTSGVDTFYGNLGTIYRAILNKNSNAIICFVTPARIGDRYTPYSDAIVDIAEGEGTLLIDCRNIGLFTTNWWYSEIRSSHPTAPMYSAMANAFAEWFTNNAPQNMDYLRTYTGAV